MPTEFHFLRPAWLLLLALAPVVVWLDTRRRARGGRWTDLVDPELKRHVLVTRGGAEQGSRWPWLAAGAIAVAALALAGPAWERQTETLYRSDDALVIALDLSRSMDVADLAPTRLTRARLKLLDLLARRNDGQTGLIVYSANAFTVVPLTSDNDTIEALVNSLTTDIMPSRGSYPAAALRKALDLLTQSGARRGRVLLIADSGYSVASAEAAKALHNAGFPVSVLGVGTLEGGPVPMAGGGFENDRQGRVAIARLEQNDLTRLAHAGGGRYAVLTSDGSDLDRLLAESPAAGRALADDAFGQTVEIWRDQGPWLVLLLLPLAALLYRRGFVLLLAVVIAPGAHADGWRDWFKTPDQQGAEALADGDAERAASLFDDEQWRAAALYRSGAYEDSAEALAAVDTITAHYNRGNALARQGRYEAAIEAYDAALTLDPEHDDARYNKALLERQRDQGDPEGGQGGDGEPQQGDGDQSDSEPSDGGDDSDGQSGSNQSSEPANGEESDGSASSESGGSDGDSEGRREEREAEQIEALREAMAAAAQEEAGEPPGPPAQPLSPEQREQQEREEAMDQWLRRVPDDPGGLLRRKFREQYRRLGRDQDGNSLWPDNEEEPW